VDAIGRADQVALYLLCEPDFPFVQDGWRDGETIRDWMHGRFVAELAKTGVETLRLRGPLDARLREARGAIEELLRRPFDL
jgi:nicotinamide riboside kinase